MRINGPKKDQDVTAFYLSPFWRIGNGPMCEEQTYTMQERHAHHKGQSHGWWRWPVGHFIF